MFLYQIGRSQSGKKRKRRKEMLSQLAGADHMMMNKRRSSVSELGMLSVSGSFLDTPSPQGSKAALYSTASEAASMSGTNLRLPTSPPATPIKGIISEASSQASSIQQVWLSSLKSVYLNISYCVCDVASNIQKVCLRVTVYRRHRIELLNYI